MTKLVFADNTELEIYNVSGGPRYIQNAQRDVLTIRVPPEAATLDELIAMFKDPAKTASLVTVQEQEINGEVQQITNHIGEHYTLYVSAANTVDEKPAPGSVAPPEMVEYNEVVIAQKTYMEIMVEQILLNR